MTRAARFDDTSATVADPFKVGKLLPPVAALAVLADMPKRRNQCAGVCPRHLTALPERVELPESGDSPRSSPPDRARYACGVCGRKLANRRKVAADLERLAGWVRAVAS